MRAQNRATVQRGTMELSLLAMLLAVAAFAYFDRVRLAGMPGVVALQLAFAEPRFRAIVAQCGPSGVRLFQQATLLVDSWFPLAYASFLAGWIAHLDVGPRVRSDRPRSLLFLLPLATAVLDWTENALHLAILLDLTRDLGRPVLLASLAAAAKWTLIASAITAIIVRSARQVLRGRSN